MRNGQLTRVLSLYRTLLCERRSIDSLARDFSVTTRTVRRDLDALADAGVPLCKSTECDDGPSQARVWWVNR
jgi:predicted DNA-binding transcriptional regulator YafY